MSLPIAYCRCGRVLDDDAARCPHEVRCCEWCRWEDVCAECWGDAS